MVKQKDIRKTYRWQKYLWEVRREKAKARRKRNYSKLTSMSVPSGMPLQRVANLRYAQHVNVTSTTGSIGSNVFRANGIYDPDYTGTGHQPMGRDQWAALFNHAVVLGSKITVEFVSENPETELYWAGVMLSPTLTVPYTTALSFREGRKGQARLRNPAFGKPTTLCSKYSAKKFFSVKDVKDNLNRLGAAIGSNPSEDAAFIVWIQALNAGTVTAAAVCTIDYIVQFSEPKDLTAS